MIVDELRSSLADIYSFTGVIVGLGGHEVLEIALRYVNKICCTSTLPLFSGIRLPGRKREALDSSFSSYDGSKIRSKLLYMSTLSAQRTYDTWPGTSPELR